MLSLAALLAGYLAGSIPTGLILARLRGIDIRAVGSGNIGATNVARALGKPMGALVLVIDAIKGYVPVALAEPRLPEVWVVAVGLAAIVGHVFPVWLRFRGGKGVATGLGVFAALAPVPALGAVLVYIIVALLTRISSLGSLSATTTLLVAMLLAGTPRPTLALGVAAWLLIVIRHRDNIRRLLSREEGKV